VEREIKGSKGTIVSCWVDKEKDIGNPLFFSLAFSQCAISVWAPEGIIADSLLGYDLRSGTISHVRLLSVIHFLFVSHFLTEIYSRAIRSS